MKLTKSYFSIFAEDFELMKSKLKAEEIVEMLSGMSDMCMFGETQYKPNTKPQEYFWEKILAKYNKDLSCYNASVENGKKGGRPSKNKPERNPEETQNITHKKPRENPDGNPEQTQTETHLTPNTLHLTLNTPPDITKVISSPQKEEKQKRFQKPSIDEIKDYCIERNNNINAEAFYDHYESVGWKIGKSPMKDWKAAVRKWEINQKNKMQWKTIDAKPDAFDIFNQAMDEIERRAAQ